METTRKLEAPLKYAHKAKVTYVYGFPIDMLRYDRCMPDTEADSHKIAFSNAYSLTGRGELNVIKYSHEKNWDKVWTFGRWQSFGCEVSEPKH